MKFQFNNCTLDSDLAQVVADGQSRSLKPQTLKILSFLIANRDAVVTKQQLIDHVWDGRIIADAALSTAIKDARIAVGDDGSRQHTIRTVHGHGFRFVADLQEVDEATPVNAGRSDQVVIAVLPFRTIATEPDDILIADGITEEVITTLSCFRELSVLSHRTTKHISASNLALDEIRRSYGADFVVDGSIRRSSDQMRATIQISDTDSGILIGTEQVDHSGKLSAVFAVMEDTARIIAGRIGSRHGRLALQVREKAAAGRSQSLDTYLLVARFYEYYRTYDPDIHAEVRDAIPEALDDDAASSQGWAAYAMCLIEEYRFHINQREDVDALKLGAEAARKAVDADPHNAFAHMTLALARFYQKDLPGFRDAGNRALELNPGHCDVLAEIGSCHAFLGEEDRAIELLDRAIELSPIHPGWYHHPKSWRYARAGFYEAAIVEIEKIPMPGFFWYHANLAWFHANIGQKEQAKAHADAMLMIFPDFETQIFAELELTNVSVEQAEIALSGWRKAGLRIAPSRSKS